MYNEQSIENQAQDKHTYESMTYVLSTRDEESPSPRRKNLYGLIARNNPLK